nr:hypothetical protein [Streptomyces sp. NRRL F-4474]
MRVLEVVVDPVVLRDAADVQLTQADDRVLPAVPVDGERGREGVVALDLLELLEGRRDDVRVEQAQAGRGVGSRPQLGAVLGLRDARVVLDLGPGDPVGVARRLDVLLDVRGFLGLLVRLDLELLHDRRVEPADQDRREHHQAEADDRQLPGAAPQRREEQHGADRGDGHEDRLRRQVRVRVDVPQARPVVGGLEVAGLHGEPVPVEPVRHRLERDE